MLDSDRSLYTTSKCIPFPDFNTTPSAIAVPGPSGSVGSLNLSIDDKKINQGQIGEITSRLKQSYMDIVLGKSDSHLSWLTFIK